MLNCIEEKRKALGLTRAEFADAMKVDYATAWRWEHGKMLPDPSRMRQLADLLQTDLTELLLTLFAPPIQEEKECVIDISACLEAGEN